MKMGKHAATSSDSSMAASSPCRLPFFAISRTAIAGHGIGGGDVPSMALVLGSMEGLAKAMKEVSAAAGGSHGGGGGRHGGNGGGVERSLAWERTKGDRGLIF
jgi:hypothetical protein